ncbi:hypothetical protein F2Q70_00029417 [Brassica cretica]|uniref:Uncharacterized protein n=1 Tax=Brassica cretica TaxID=69181 RepID=A0A8S9FE31_BRACR|nr:hypothetical protein F2Q70_00029417 [Brassica cretica]
MEMDLAKPPDRSSSPEKVGGFHDETQAIEGLGKGSGKVGEIESRDSKKVSWVEVAQERKGGNVETVQEKVKELAQLAIGEQKESVKSAGESSTQEVEVRNLDMQIQNGGLKQFLDFVLSDLEETEKTEMVQSMNIAMENQNEDVEEKVLESPELQNEVNVIEVGKKGRKKG